MTAIQIEMLKFLWLGVILLFNREIVTTQIDTIRHQFHCFLLLSFDYLALMSNC